MTVETDSDRATFVSDWNSALFSPGDTYPNRNDKTATIKGIFDKEYFRAEGEFTAVSTSEPQFHARTGDIDGAERNSMIEIGEDKYKVVAVEPDGTGFTVLILEGPRY